MDFKEVFLAVLLALYVFSAVIAFVAAVVICINVWKCNKEKEANDSVGIIGHVVATFVTAAIAAVGGPVTLGFIVADLAESKSEE